MIRITGGKLRGRSLPAPVPEGVRPTSSRVREALFNLAGQDLQGMSMLDLCGGTGLIAIEAFSRGAEPVTVAERNRAAIRCIRTNIETLGLSIRIIAADTRATFLEPADFVFVDPPYAEPIVGWIERAGPLARQLLIVESTPDASWPQEAGSLRLDRVRTYGDSALAVYR